MGNISIYMKTKTCITKKHTEPRIKNHMPAPHASRCSRKPSKQPGANRTEDLRGKTLSISISIRKKELNLDKSCYL